MQIISGRAKTVILIMYFVSLGKFVKKAPILSAKITTYIGVEVRTLRAGNRTTVYSIIYVQNYLGYIPASYPDQASVHILGGSVPAKAKLTTIPSNIINPVKVKLTNNWILFAFFFEINIELKLGIIGAYPAAKPINENDIPIISHFIPCSSPVSRISRMGSSSAIDTIELISISEIIDTRRTVDMICTNL